MTPEEIRQRLVLLVGARNREPEQFDRFFHDVARAFDSLDRVSVEDLNRLLVAAGFNRVSGAWFEYFTSLGSSFDARLEIWRQRAMLRYANFRHAFRQLGSVEKRDLIAHELDVPRRDFASRGDVKSSLKHIARRDTPFLGYLAGGTIKELNRAREAGEALEPADESLISRYNVAWQAGVDNLYEYCVAEYMDVYVATSMRDSEDFYSVSRFVDSLFDPLARTEEVARLSYFDPTQSTHDDRVTKGIVEGLMLKRAFATIYLAQEKDTLGKDSELATTLVQGKPVIAYVPSVVDQDSFIAELVDDLKVAAEDDPVARDVETPEYKRLMSRLLSLPPKWWDDSPWAGTPIETEAEFERALAHYANCLATHYDERANFLKSGHPLGIQVALASGVPNGVLVVRDVDECREVLREVLNGSLEFSIEARSQSGEIQSDLEGGVMDERRLRESRTGSIHRVAMGETPVANAFWNRYFS